MTIDNWCIIIIGNDMTAIYYRIEYYIVRASRITLRYTESSDAADILVMF